jgi:hypothetical protein
VVALVGLDEFPAVGFIRREAGEGSQGRGFDAEFFLEFAAGSGEVVLAGIDMSGGGGVPEPVFGGKALRRR